MKKILIFGLLVIVNYSCEQAPLKRETSKIETLEYTAAIVKTDTIDSIIESINNYGKFKVSRKRMSYPGVSQLLFSHRDLDPDNYIFSYYIISDSLSRKDNSELRESFKGLACMISPYANIEFKIHYYKFVLGCGKQILSDKLAWDVQELLERLMYYTDSVPSDKR